jgi:hypothetical protein
VPWHLPVRHRRPHFNPHYRPAVLWPASSILEVKVHVASVPLMPPASLRLPLLQLWRKSANGVMVMGEEAGGVGWGLGGGRGWVATMEAERCH